MGEPPKGRKASSRAIAALEVLSVTLMSGMREFTVESCRNEMIRIIQQVFRTMLQTEAETISGKQSLGRYGLTARVHFGGAWNGTLSIQCSTAEAKLLAKLFAGGESSGELEQAECEDVLGELANIVAGNLKVVLPKGTQMSHPETVAGTLVLPAEEEVPIQIQTFIRTHTDPVSMMLAVRS
jgi:CheY-specific phosphatase CheX